MDFGGARKRGRPEGGLNGNAGFKRNRQEMESFSSGLGTKSKPCIKFFSTAGCPFGEGCHFLHYVPGGIKAVSEMSNMGGGNLSFPPSRKPIMGHPHSISDGLSPQVKTKMCKKFNTVEGCKFGEKCHFAHSERELGRPSAGPVHEDPRGMGGHPSRMGGRYEAPPPSAAGAFGGAAASFGASATAKISVDASLAGTIIGKGGVNSKQICRVTGVKLSIRDHESDTNLRNIELEGTFEQIQQASAMVRELIVSISASGHGAGPGAMNNSHQQYAGGAPHSAGSAQGGNFKTKLCENFAKGSCTFGERCHFAHGPADLHK
ncbi:hypothetical protein GIB67_016873 [Kingdonia uniflora]|uniref:C3H1-type domain-containing protein n=1 Tax=Kingdonia uniflora TaxID=39325 RepID=A0A7J7M380_9MAGN|nr:hypothetical protein GIB67_016873 [Kingdonia uniflora]